MQAFGGRAIVASALPEEAKALSSALIDAGFSEVICVSDGLSAIRQAQAKLTDVIIADAVLPVLDGNALARRIYEVPLNVYPAVVLLAAKGMCLKTAECTLEKPVNVDELMKAVDSLRAERRTIPDEKFVRAQQLMDLIGIPQHCGREYLLRAVEIVWLDARLVKSLSKRVYPAVAEKFGADEKHVGRAMRHVIDAAWRGGEMEAQYEIFGDTIDARRGNPTLSEMIARIADILRWEGKA